MDSSNVKYNCPGVVLRDYYLKSFYFQPGFFSYIFQWSMEGWGGTRSFLGFFFPMKMLVKNNIYTGETTLDYHSAHVLGRPASLLHVTHLPCKLDQPLPNPLARCSGRALITRAAEGRAVTSVLSESSLENICIKARKTRVGTSAILKCKTVQMFSFFSIILH